MDKQQIIDGNKLIAAFADPEDVYGYTDKGWWNKVKYHESWDWLMPVVEKINGTEIPDNKFPASVIIYRTTCHINDDSDIIIETRAKDTLIECVWSAVVGFIKWYNQLKK